ncbi:MAG: hypothetical protein ACK5B9_00555 [Flavobacteriia bacterium]|jgi:hypothetical protein
MKKVLGVAALLSVFALGSCKKDYTCECVSTAGSISSTATTTIANSTKGDAEAACDAGDATASAGGVTSTVACSLK